MKEFGAAEDKIKVNILEDCVIDLSEVFSEAWEHGADPVFWTS